MTCQECGQEFALDEWDNAAAFGRALDEHVQQHHQALFAAVVDQANEDPEL
jgi:hypothetical protein